MSAVGTCNCMVAFGCRYVHMLSTVHVAELGDRSLLTCVRKDGRKKSKFLVRPCCQTIYRT